SPAPVGNPKPANWRRLLGLGVFLDVINGVLYRRHFFGVLIGHFDAEGLLERHHQFNLVERVRAEVVDERSGRSYFRLVHSELLDVIFLSALLGPPHPIFPRNLQSLESLTNLSKEFLLPELPLRTRACRAD